MPPLLESSLSAITRVCRRSRVQLRASVILEDRGGEGRGREQVQVDDARRRGIRVIRRENTYSPISIATLSATPTTCSPRQGSKFLAKLQILGTVSEFTNMVLVTLEDDWRVIEVDVDVHSSDAEVYYALRKLLRRNKAESHLVCDELVVTAE